MPGPSGNAFLDLLKGAFGRLFGAQSGAQGGGYAQQGSPEWRFVDEVMKAHHFTTGAQDWLRSVVNLRVDDLGSRRGGGYWIPDRKEVHLFTGQDEAALHELAHAWWHYSRHGHEEEMMQAVVRLSEEPDPAYHDMQNLAYGYVHGIPAQNWKGMLVERNDWEMFAGLASGSMGDMRKLPAYVRNMYQGLFEMP